MSEFRALFPQHNLRSTSKEYYEWKLLKNPYKQGKIFLERKQGIVVGSTSITPKRVSIGGRLMAAAELGDGFTHPEYQRQGIFSKLSNACTQFTISQGIEVIYGTPNSQSLPVLMKLGYRPCPFVKLNYMAKHRWSLLATIRSMAKLMLHRKCDQIFLYLSAILKQTFSRPLFSCAKGTVTEQSFDILSIDKFTDEIDGLWGSQRYGFSTIRDKTYINWRYFENPDEYDVIVAKKGDKCLGYVVTKLSRNRRVGVICDFITIDDRLDVFGPLIREAEKELKKAGVKRIELLCVENSPYYRALLDQGYCDQSRQPIIVFSGSDSGRTLLEADAKWHFVLSDSDNI